MGARRRSGGRAAGPRRWGRSPGRLGASSLVVAQPAAAAAALARVPDDDRARPVLAARLAWGEGRLTDALEALERAPGLRARRLGALLTAEQSVLAASPRGKSMIMNSFGQTAPISVHDHESSAGTKGRVL